MITKSRYLLVMLVVLLSLPFACSSREPEDRWAAEGLNELAVALCNHGWEEVSNYLKSEKQEAQERVAQKKVEGATQDDGWRRALEQQERLVERGEFPRGDELVVPIVEEKRQPVYALVGLHAIGDSETRFFGQVTLVFRGIRPATTSAWGELNQDKLFTFALTIEMIYGVQGWDFERRRYEGGQELLAEKFAGEAISPTYSLHCDPVKRDAERNKGFVRRMWDGMVDQFWSEGAGALWRRLTEWTRR